MGQTTFLFLLDTGNLLGTIFLIAWPTGVALIILYHIRSNRKAKRIIAQWAEENGLNLLDVKQRLGTGPFDEWPGRGVGYFEFKVADKYGTEATGWARYDMTPFSAWEPDIMWTPKPTR